MEDKNKPKVIDEMQPLKDYLQGKSTTNDFVGKCREISNTETADFEVIPPNLLTDKKDEK